MFALENASCVILRELKLQAYNCTNHGLIVEEQTDSK